MRQNFRSDKKKREELKKKKKEEKRLRRLSRKEDGPTEIAPNPAPDSVPLE